MRRMAYLSIIVVAVISTSFLIYKVSTYPVEIRRKETEHMQGIDSSGRKVIPRVKIKRYYTATVGLSDSRKNVTIKELFYLARKGKVIVLARDKKELTRVLGCSLEETAAAVSKIKLPEGSIALLRLNDLVPKFKALTINGKSIWDNADYPLYTEVGKELGEKQFNRKKIIRATSVGDIMLSRTVYRKMASEGYSSPFINVTPRLSRADIAFGNLENPLSDEFRPLPHGTSFVAPKKSAQALAGAGLDVLGLANNHTGNFGAKAFTDTLDALKQNGIKYTGGGTTEFEAKSYTVLKARGKRFAFLNINSIPGDIVAKGKSPGSWRIDLAPWGKIDKKQVDELLKKIRIAQKNSDFVVVMTHWGQEYTHDPNPEMKTLARGMINAGADLIVGTHPHWTQGVEAYKNGFIAYSLGNFVFDQEWSHETKRGLILDTIFYDDRLVSTSLTPVLIENFHRPRILTEKEGKPVMDAVWGSTRKIDGQ